MDAKEYQVEREGLGPLVFVGELISDVSTHKEYKTRWIEIYLYKTETDRYVIETLGKSIVKGELTRRTVTIHDSADEAVRALVNKKTNSFSKPSIDLLHIAEHGDNDISDAWAAISREAEYV